MACARCKRKSALQAAGYEASGALEAPPVAPATETAIRKYGLYLSVGALCAWLYYKDRPQPRRRSRR